MAKPAAHALLDSGLVVLGWLVFALLVAGGRPLVAYDAFRDMAYAHAILGGRLGQDPTLLHLPAWYPPGNPLAFACGSMLTRVPVNTLYATSVYWLGWTNPLALFWLARRAWGRLAAWLALPCVLLGSYWVLLHALMPMPSVQAVALALATLIAWREGARGSVPALATAAALGALTTWVHPLCGALALGSIALHGGLAPLFPPRDPAGRALALRALGVAAVGGALAAPAVLPGLLARAVNDAPRHWFAPELHDPRFALMAHAPLVWAAGLFGLFAAIRDWQQDGWLVAWCAIGTLGMLLGYAAHDLQWHVPWVIPHEFQWHAQLALGLAAALGMVRLATRLAGRARPSSAPARAGWALALALPVVGPGALAAPEAGRFVTVLDERWQRFMTMSQELAAQAGPGAVIAAPPEAGYFVAAFTGLRAVALPAGHTNPATDPFVRFADADSLLLTVDRMRFDSLATRYSLGGLLLPATDSMLVARQRARAAAWGMFAPVTLSDSSDWIAYRPAAAHGTGGTTP